MNSPEWMTVPRLKETGAVSLSASKESAALEQFRRENLQPNAKKDLAEDPQKREWKTRERTDGKGGIKTEAYQQFYREGAMIQQGVQDTTQGDAREVENLINMQSTTATIKNTFSEDVLRGLSAMPKFFSSKYFYDNEGSRLFQEIMKLPEYYLTRAEIEIFSSQTREIYSSFAAHNTPFDLIELGAGDGTKTSLLVEYFLAHKAEFTYVPIDISGEALEVLTEKFAAQFPNLSVQSEQGDYFNRLETFKNKSNKRKIILFLGSNIGNFSQIQAQEFFRALRALMNENDILFIGFDLQKNPLTILQAYDDAQGVTAAFNLNLLKRINRELGANFMTENFSHYATYHPIEGAARSFLISRIKQTIFVEALNEKFEFAMWEPIFMEISQKYSLAMINNLAETSGFRVEKNLFDDKKFYTNSIWKPI